MASNYKLTYNVDIVFCIDCTESMDNILNIVKNRAQNFYSDVQAAMKDKGEEIDQLRVRVVAFRDYMAYDEEKRKKTHCNEPMLITSFFDLPEEAHDLEANVKSLQPIGGGDDPEDGLEALAYAIRSDWTTKGSKDRHIIVLWTDQKPHRLGFGGSASKYPKGMARDFEELTQWWGDKECSGFMPEQPAKRLILFAPNEGEWETISENWDNVVHLPSKAGDHLQDLDYQTILSSIAYTIVKSELKNNIPGFEKPKPTEERAEIKSQKSLDMLYAESHGMWVCRFCETINDGRARYCDACGAKK